jgi:polyisoprenyl-teichoic acid--peptidoglycan teichoic acid transferase
MKFRIFVAVIYLFILLIITLWTLSIQVGKLTKEFELEYSDIFASVDREIIKKGYIDVLILGIGGGQHEGPNLTDSIILARYYLHENRVNTVSLPRDLWHDSIKDKINSIYAYSFDKNRADISWTSDMFYELIGIRMDTVIVIDFQTFERVIDTIGGITINLDKSFVDNHFPRYGMENSDCVPFDPNYNCRYTTLSFPKGRYEIKGRSALSFVRSRYADGGAGSDFSRSQRQQIVITSIKDKLIELVKDRELTKITNVLSAINRDIKRDRSNDYYLTIIRNMLLNSQKLQIKPRTLGMENFYVPSFDLYDGRYVLLPEDDDYEAFQRKIIKILSAKN